MQWDASITKTKISFKKLNRRLLIINATLLVAFFTSQIAVTSMVGTKSTEVEDIRKQKDQLRLENEILTAQIDESRSVEKSKDIIEKYALKEKPVYLLEAGDIESVAINSE